ncbi:N-acetylmuramoyl-L-alanine amidase [uncultured Ruthenibacterium sp.]|uniref:N-acetylmuramoyl-L-alanine amidase family protein n=1 Tax=uncultured Ruthenibacterium sp. TaxID=1905347 RepID=UPI00349EFCBC
MQQDKRYTAKTAPRKVASQQTVHRRRVAAARRRRRRRKRILLSACIALVLLMTAFLLKDIFLQDVPTQADGSDLPKSNIQNVENDITYGEAQDADGHTQPVASYEFQTSPPYVVALDAGHGGYDIGAEGVIDEVQLTEGTVDALYALLEEDPNYTPVRCRENGESATSGDRAMAAAEAKASLLLSIHGNSDPYFAESYGFECYPQPPGRIYHDDALVFAQAIAQQFGSAGHRLRGENGVRYIYYQGTEETGYEKQVVEISDTSVHEDETFGLLEKASCPAVLAEQCFLTNASDVDAWGSESGCQAAAECYYRAICEYFGTQPIA